jgi:hypothetical protein
MSSVHQQVKKRAGKQQQIGENPEKVRPMLREKEESNDQEKADQRQIKMTALTFL